MTDLIEIKQRALDFLLMTPVSLNCFIGSPNLGSEISQLYHFSLDLEKKYADKRRKGVVGINGKKLPITPKAKLRNPKKRKSFLVIS